VPPPSQRPTTQSPSAIKSAAPKIQIGKRVAEIGHERFDVFPTPAWLVWRVVQQHFGCCNLVDHCEIQSFPRNVNQRPDGLVILLDGHDVFL
jgi:hypothetical protein